MEQVGRGEAGVDRQRARQAGPQSGPLSAAVRDLRGCRAPWPRLLLAAVAAALLGFAVHVLYGQGWAKSYVGAAAAAGRLEGIIQQPYPPPIVIVAAATAVLPALGKVLVFLLVRERLPGTTGWRKGLSFGALLLLAGDGLLRVPVMNLSIGNPLDVVLVQSAEAWVISLVTGLAIGVMASWTVSSTE